MPWPPGIGDIFSPHTLRGSLKMQTISPRLATYNPVSDDLVVHNHSMITILQPDTLMNPITLSRRFVASLITDIPNYVQLFDWGLLFQNNDGMDGNYLFVTPAKFTSALWPLISQKLDRGYRVTMMYTEDVGTDPAVLKTEISDWWNSLATDTDAYCLLVGDEELVPMHPDVIWSSVRPSDYWYACVEDVLWSSFGIGRLTGDVPLDIEEQVAKILEYEESPPWNGGWYNNVQQTVYRFTDQGFHETVDAIQAMEYDAGSLDFTVRSGEVATDTSNDVIDDINEGQHFVMYHGHGNDTAWASWTSTSGSLTNTHIQNLANGTSTPIIWSGGCQNSSIHQRDECIAEQWMQRTNGPVAHVGATRNNWIVTFGKFAKWFLWLSYDTSTPNISYAIRWGHLLALIETNYNEWALRNLYETQLLGDPEMKVWTANPNPYAFYKMPMTIPYSDWVYYVQYEIPLNAVEELPAIISYSFEPANGEDTVYYSPVFADSYGSAAIPLELNEEGTLRIRAWNDFENRKDTVATIQVVAPSCQGDVNDDGIVNVEDLLILLGSWGECANDDTCSADFNGDGSVSIDDLLVLIAAWGSC